MAISSSLKSTSAIHVIAKGELTDLVAWIQLWTTSELKIVVNWTASGSVSITVFWSSDTVLPADALIIVNRCLASYTSYFTP